MSVYFGEIQKNELYPKMKTTLIPPFVSLGNSQKQTLFSSNRNKKQTV